MNTIYVNGRIEAVGDYYDGIEVVRGDVGEDWYEFMRREISDADTALEELDREIESYRQNEESLIEEYQGYLHEIQELAEQCIEEEVLTGPTTKRMQKIYEYLDTIKNICFNNILEIKFLIFFCFVYCFFLVFNYSI